MRSMHVSFGLVFLVAGCAATAGSSRGVTYRDHAGTTVVIFTNATPQKMCELRMTLEDNRDLGDNWLPEDGLASGKSAEFKVRPGTYQATWSTCKQGDLYYAGTLIADTAISVSQQTQLYAYTADKVAPTKRAAVLTRDYKIVKFSGQAIGAIPANVAAAPAQDDLFAKEEAKLARGKSAPPKVDQTARFEKFSAADFVDPVEKKKYSKKKTTTANKPSLVRKINVIDKKVRFSAKN